MTQQTTGLFASLTSAQQARVLAYQGDETIMPADAPQTTPTKASRARVVGMHDNGSLGRICQFSAVFLT